MYGITVVPRIIDDATEWVAPVRVQFRGSDAIVSTIASISVSAMPIAKMASPMLSLFMQI